MESGWQRDVKFHEGWNLCLYGSGGSGGGGGVGGGVDGSDGGGGVDGGVDGERIVVLVMVVRLSCIEVVEWWECCV